MAAGCCFNFAAIEPQSQPQESRSIGLSSPTGSWGSGTVSSQPVQKAGKIGDVLGSLLFQRCSSSGRLIRPVAQKATYLNKEMAEHCWCEAFHVCCPHHSGSVSLPRPLVHKKVPGCCKSPKLLAFSQIIIILLTFPLLQDSVPHSSVIVPFTFFISNQILNCCCSWQVFSLFGGCMCYRICIYHSYLFRILLGYVSDMSSEEFIKTPFQVINSCFQHLCN